MRGVLTSTDQTRVRLTTVNTLALTRCYYNDDSNSVGRESSHCLHSYNNNNNNNNNISEV